jgi:hypothetical protein
VKSGLQKRKNLEDPGLAGMIPKMAKLGLIAV